MAENIFSVLEEIRGRRKARDEWAFHSSALKAAGELKDTYVKWVHEELDDLDKEISALMELAPDRARGTVSQAKQKLLELLEKYKTSSASLQTFLQQVKAGSIQTADEFTKAFRKDVTPVIELVAEAVSLRTHVVGMIDMLTWEYDNPGHMRQKPSVRVKRQAQ